MIDSMKRLREYEQSQQIAVLPQTTLVEFRDALLERMWQEVEVERARYFAACLVHGTRRLHNWYNGFACDARRTVSQLFYHNFARAMGAPAAVRWPALDQFKTLHDACSWVDVNAATGRVRVELGAALAGFFEWEPILYSPVTYSTPLQIPL